jgi:hypothetical protein
MMQREEDYLMDNDEEDIPYDRYMAMVVRYLTRRAFEDEDDKGINAIGDDRDRDQQLWDMWNWGGQAEYGMYNENLGDIEAMKGKGKGGACYNCGQQGHMARNCMNKGMGKGFGKSKGTGKNCYNCGLEGHFSRECPHPKGTGKGFGKTGEQGKGYGYGKAPPTGFGGGPRPFGGKCNHCGLMGHVAARCPSVGKGFGAVPHDSAFPAFTPKPFSQTRAPSRYMPHQSAMIAFSPKRSRSSSKSCWWRFPISIAFSLLPSLPKSLARALRVRALA